MTKETTATITNFSSNVASARSINYYYTICPSRNIWTLTPTKRKKLLESLLRFFLLLLPLFVLPPQSKASLIINRPGGASMPLINDNYQAIIQAAAGLDYHRKARQSGIADLASSPFYEKILSFPSAREGTMFLAVGESRFLSKVFPEPSLILSFFLSFLSARARAFTSWSRPSRVTVYRRVQAQL